MTMESQVSKKKIFETESGIPIDAVYSRLNHEVDDPGDFPFTRGIHATMYRDRLWTMRQYAGFSTAEESNLRYKYLLKQGTTGLSVAFDLPTQIGYDSDHLMSEGEVGKVGVAIDSLRDIETLFNGIELQKITTSMTINATAFILLAMYTALAKKQGADLKKISGTIQNDILKEYAARGTYIYPPQPSMKLITDIFEFCSHELPSWNTISVSGYHMREAGCTAAQEIAFTLSNGKAYLKAAIDRGLDINVFSKRISFFFNAHNDLFEEVAKFRAARRMWAKITSALGATDARAQMLRFHSQTGGSTLTAQQPINNIVRVTVQALAAVLGGTQSLHTNGFDEALSLPTAEAATIAVRTQQILANESGVTQTVDPLGGSFYIEHLTDELEKSANHYMQKIDAMGGSVSAIESGYIQEEIARAAYHIQQKMEDGEQIVVGVNKFVQDETVSEKTFQVDDSIQQTQIDKIKILKRERNNENVSASLQQLEQTILNRENVMANVIHAVEQYATLGEIADVFRKIYGEYKA